MSSEEHAKMSSGTVFSQQSSPAKPEDKESEVVTTIYCCRISRHISCTVHHIIENIMTFSFAIARVYRS